MHKPRPVTRVMPKTCSHSLFHISTVSYFQNRPVNKRPCFTKQKVILATNDEKRTKANMNIFDKLGTEESPATTQSKNTEWNLVALPGALLRSSRMHHGLVSRQEMEGGGRGEGGGEGLSSAIYSSRQQLLSVVFSLFRWPTKQKRRWKKSFWNSKSKKNQNLFEYSSI